MLRKAVGKVVGDKPIRYKPIVVVLSVLGDPEELLAEYEKSVAPP
jgi:hypothetical protein